MSVLVAVPLDPASGIIAMYFPTLVDVPVPVVPASGIAAE